MCELKGALRVNADRQNANLPFGDRMARKYMRVYEHRPQLQHDVSSLTRCWRAYILPLVFIFSTGCYTRS